MVSPDASVDLRTFRIRSTRLTDIGVRKDSVAAVEPTIRAPCEGVECFVCILPAPAIQQDFRWTVGRIVSIAIRNEQQIRSCTDPHSAKTNFKTADKVELFLKDRAFVELIIAIGILKNENPVASIFVFYTSGIGIRLGDPESAAIIKGHSDRLLNIRFAGE